MAEDNEIKAEEDKGFVSYFHKLPHPEDLVRIFDRKAYYTLHGEDARLVARDYHHSLKSLRQWTSTKSGDAPLDCLTVRQGLELESVLNFLLKSASRRVELLARRENEKGNSWQVMRKASPGNLAAFEDELASHSIGGDSPVFMAIYAQHRQQQTVFGVAYADTTLRTLGVSEFIDGEQLPNLESVLIACGVRECCLLTDDSNYLQARIVELANRINIPIVSKKRSDFKSDDIEQDLTRLLGGVRNISSHLDKKCAMACVSCLISHLELLCDSSNFGKYAFSVFDLSQYMRLDSSALRALNLVPQQNDVNQQMNLLSFLNKCQTAMGSRLLNQWVKQPLLNIAQIQRRQDLLTVFFEDAAVRDQLRTALKRTADTHRLCRKVLVGKANLQDLCVLYQFTLVLPVLRDALKECGGGVHQDAVKESFVEPAVKLCGDLDKYQQLIEASVDLDSIQQHEYQIKPEYSEELQEYDEKKRKYNDLIQQLHEEVAQELGVLEKSLKLEYNDKNGWHFRLSSKDEKSVRKKLVGEYAPFDTTKQGCKFQGKKLYRLNEKFQKYAQAYRAAQAEIVLRVMKVAATYVPVFVRAAECVARLDVLLSWAHVFATTGKDYTRPIIGEAGSDMVIVQARHPCMELLDGVHYIPNDIEFRRDTSTFHIITGPNMGGKSTHIRTAGLIVLMAQLGCFVPAKSAKVPITDCILARVGAGDSQLRGISTFMAEMLETAAILRTATRNSLVIIDELGRGTSTYDGFGLAWAISEEVCEKIGSFCFFATHFHELTALADRIPTVKNFHVKAMTDNGQLAMLYRIEPGPSDQSLGIHVAELARFPEEVVRVAKRKASELEDFGLGQSVAKKVKTNLHGVDCSEEQRKEGLALMEKCVAATDDKAKLSALLAEARTSTNPLVSAIVKQCSQSEATMGSGVLSNNSVQSAQQPMQVN